MLIDTFYDCVFGNYLVVCLEERLYFLHFVPCTDEAGAVVGVNVLAHWADQLSIIDGNATSRLADPSKTTRILVIVLFSFTTA